MHTDKSFCTLIIFIAPTEGNTRNRYETTKEVLQSLTLNNFDCEQLAAVEACVLRLVANGTPTVELVADSMGMHHTKFRRRVKAITGIAAQLTTSPSCA